MPHKNKKSNSQHYADYGNSFKKNNLLHSSSFFKSTEKPQKKTLSEVSSAFITDSLIPSADVAVPFVNAIYSDNLCVMYLIEKINIAKLFHTEFFATPENYIFHNVWNEFLNFFSHKGNLIEDVEIFLKHIWEDIKNFFNDKDQLFSEKTEYPDNTIILLMQLILCTVRFIICLISLLADTIGFFIRRKNNNLTANLARLTQLGIMFVNYVIFLFKNIIDLLVKGYNRKESVFSAIQLDTISTLTSIAKYLIPVTTAISIVAFIFGVTYYFYQAHVAKNKMKEMEAIIDTLDKTLTASGVSFYNKYYEHYKKILAGDKPNKNDKYQTLCKGLSKEALNYFMQRHEYDILRREKEIAGHEFYFWGKINTVNLVIACIGLLGFILSTLPATAPVVMGLLVIKGITITAGIITTGVIIYFYYKKFHHPEKTKIKNEKENMECVKQLNWPSEISNNKPSNRLIKNKPFSENPHRNFNSLFLRKNNLTNSTVNIEPKNTDPAQDSIKSFVNNYSSQ